MSQAARETLRRLDGIRPDNAQPLRSMIGNLDTFSGVLARNSDRLDGIVVGLERMTGGAAAKGRIATYDLTAPSAFPAAEKLADAQLAIPDPTALSVLDSEKILTRSAAGVSSPLPDAQWSDTVPKLLQARLVQAFENAGTLGAVSRPVEGVTGDYQLLIDIRRFQIAAGAQPTADVELAAKLLDGKGRIADSRVFRATAPATGMDAAAATSALDQAFGTAATELVTWTSRAIADQSAAAVAPKGPARGKATRG